MATPNVGILTTAGKALIDKVNSGQTKISFSKIVFSSMDNFQLSDTQIKALTAIAPQEVVVSSPQTTLDTNSGETRIRATGTNEKLADGVYVKTYGVFAKDDTGNEILYGVTVSPNPNYFPAYDGVTPQAVTYSYKTVIQETSNITMTNSNDVYASQEDLTEALQPYAKTVDVNQQLDKKVNIADMRKPASDVAGIEEVSTLQTQVDNSAVGTNLAPGTSSDWQKVSVPSGWGTADLSNRVYEIKDGETYTLQVEARNITSPIMLETYYINATERRGGRLTPIQVADKDGKIIVTFTANLPKDYAYFMPDLAFSGSLTTTGSYEFRRFKIEKGSVATDWCPNPSEILTKSDDSKVAHLSGANNFDTVPTVNNNPLLLASSLPSDLARTSQQTNFTAGLQSGGVDVATAADLKSIEDSAWRQLDNKYITLSDGKAATSESTVIYKIDKKNKRIYYVYSIANTDNMSSDANIDFSGIAKNISMPQVYAIYLHSGVYGGRSSQNSIENNKINIPFGGTSYPFANSLMAEYIEKPGGPWIHSNLFVAYDELV